MVARREPVDRLVDLLVAAPTCTMRAARRAAPLVAEVVRRRITVGAPDDHRLAPTGDVDTIATSDEIVDDVSSGSATGHTPTADGLAIDDYDHLAARQVVDRLGGLHPAELDAIDAYERGTRHRQTILRRIEQLRP